MVGRTGSGDLGSRPPAGASQPATTDPQSPPRPVMLLWLLRGAYVALLLGVAAFGANVFVEENDNTRAVLVALGVLALGGLVLVTDLRDKQKHITTLSAVYLGLLL